MQRVGTVCHDAIKLVLGKATATRNYHALTPKATIRQERGSTGHVMCAKMIKSHGSRLRLNDRLIMLLSLWAVQFFLETSGQFAGLCSVHLGSLRVCVVYPNPQLSTGTPSSQSGPLQSTRLSSPTIASPILSFHFNMERVLFYFDSPRRHMFLLFFLFHAKKENT